MKRGVLFVSGGYGVGKSTICKFLSEKLEIPHYSASNLIKSVNGENYTKSKAVKNKVSNQEILISEVNKLLEKNENIILDGHFCIFDMEKNVIKLPEFVYAELNLIGIHNLEADIEVVAENLMKRDKKVYDKSSLERLAELEVKQAKKISTDLKITFASQHLNYDHNDIIEVYNNVREWVK